MYAAVNNGLRINCATTCRISCLLENGSLWSTATMRGASKPQDHHCASEPNRDMRQLRPALSPGKAKTRPMAVQTTAASTTRCSHLCVLPGLEAAVIKREKSASLYCRPR